ncbi:MAG: cation transporter [Vicingaceae bacterium]|nr:cation transporter [Vicingaceae bacterium]
MKKIMFITSAALFMYLTAQICGCGSCEAKANSIENSTVVEKTKTVKLKITGMTCAGCSSHVTQTLQGVKGVSKVELEYPGDVATIEYDAATTKTEDLIAAVEKINYKAEIIEAKK